MDALCIVTQFSRPSGSQLLWHDMLNGVLAAVQPVVDLFIFRAIPILQALKNIGFVPGWHGIDVFNRFLSVANAYGAYAVATETGSIDPDCGYHPDTGKEETLSLFYRSLECMMNSAQKYNARVAIEPVSTNHTISTLKRMEDMIRRFDSDNLAIILDVANITPLSGIMERDGVSLPKLSDNALCAFLSDFISIAGPHLAAVHVKNYALDGKGAKISDLKADEGAINWNLACSFINERYPEIPFLIEGSLNDRELFLSSLEKEV